MNIANWRSVFFIGAIILTGCSTASRQTAPAPPPPPPLPPAAPNSSATAAATYQASIDADDDGDAAGENAQKWIDITPMSNLTPGTLQPPQSKYSGAYT